MREETGRKLKDRSGGKPNGKNPYVRPELVKKEKLVRITGIPIGT